MFYFLVYVNALVQDSNHNNWCYGFRCCITIGIKTQGWILVNLKRKLCLVHLWCWFKVDVHTSFGLDVESMNKLFKESLLGLRQSSFDKEWRLLDVIWVNVKICWICLKFLISFGLGFLDVEGKVFPWCKRAGFPYYSRKWIHLVWKTRILLDIKGKMFFIKEVMSIP